MIGSLTSPARGATVEDVDPEEESALVDLTRVSLAQLSSLDNTVFGRALRRLIEEADDPPEAIAGFQSSVAFWD
jgi:FXSXX-COOH protein